jgi:hypothetical protein
MSANVGLQWGEDLTRRSRFIKLAYFASPCNVRFRHATEFKDISTDAKVEFIIPGIRNAPR